MGKCLCLDRIGEDRKWKDAVSVLWCGERGKEMVLTCIVAELAHRGGGPRLELRWLDLRAP
jgi:hypothetical protein